MGYPPRMNTPEDPRIESLQDRLILADVMYSRGTPILPDAEYDQLKARYRELTGGEWLTREGGLRTKVHRKVRMGSLENCTSPEDVADWIRTNNWESDVTLLPKLDGLAVSLEYFNDHLIRASTRGDGFVGDDVTVNVLKIGSVPKKLHHAVFGDEVKFEGKFEIRGEVILLNADWKTLDPEEKSNPRNIAAGLIRRDDGVGSERLTFAPYRIVDSKGKHSVQMDLLSKIGFTFITPVTVIPLSMLTGEAAVAFYEEVDAWRKSLPFWTDGAVFFIDDQTAASEIDRDNVSVCPKSGFAYKFPPETTVSTLLGVTYKVGTQGTLTPTAKIAPVRIAGTTVKSATLCNHAHIARIGVAVGDKVLLQKAGEIIPQIVEVVSQDPDRTPIPSDIACPSCGSATAFRKNPKGDLSPFLACTNACCSGRRRAQVVAFALEHNILDLGPEMASMLGDETEKSAADHPLLRLYDGTLNRVYFGKNGQKVMEEVKAKASTLTVEAFIGSLGIPNVRTSRAKQFIDAACGRLDTVDGWLAGVPEECAGAYAGLASEYLAENREWISQLAHTIKVVSPDNSNAGKKVVVLTGTFSVKKAELEALILASKSYTVGDSVKKGTAYLAMATADSGSKKAQDAAKKGVSCISEHELRELLNADQ